jgi:hypothetical protein
VSFIDYKGFLYIKKSWGWSLRASDSRDALFWEKISIYFFLLDSEMLALNVCLNCWMLFCIIDDWQIF